MRWKVTSTASSAAAPSGFPAEEVAARSGSHGAPALPGVEARSRPATRCRACRLPRSAYDLLRGAREDSNWRHHVNSPISPRQPVRVVRVFHPD